MGRQEVLRPVGASGLMEASSRSLAVAPRAQDLPATLFGLTETDKTCATRRIATARKNAPAHVSKLQTSNSENHLLCIFSTVFGFQREKQSKPGDTPLTSAAKRFARLPDSGGIPQQEDLSYSKRCRVLSCRAQSRHLLLFKSRGPQKQYLDSSTSLGMAKRRRSFWFFHHIAEIFRSSLSPKLTFENWRRVRGY